MVIYYCNNQFNITRKGWCVVDNRPIGMFDSGVGGFTLVKEAFNILPNEAIIYFGDTARSPYGVKTDEKILSYSRDIVEFLISQGVKLIVIACNTATIASVDILKREFDIPIIGVVEPCVDAVLADIKSEKIGLMGTDFTVNSKKYEKIIKSKDKNLTVVGKGCPKLVTLAEEGVFNKEESNTAVKECLKDLLSEDVDTLILACTHFPLHLQDIKRNVPEWVTIVDPALKTMEATFKILKEKDILREDLNKPVHRFICSANIEDFKKVYDVVFKETNEIVEIAWGK